MKKLAIIALLVLTYAAVTGSFAQDMGLGQPGMSGCGPEVGGPLAGTGISNCAPQVPSTVIVTGPALQGSLMLEDGTSFLLLEDASSHLCFEGGC